MDSNIKYSHRQMLLVELSTDECYIGEFLKSNKNHIELDNVYDVDKKENLNGIQLFYKNDILSIKVYQSKLNDIENDDGLSTFLTSSSSVEPSETSSSPPSSSLLLLPPAKNSTPSKKISINDNDDHDNSPKITLNELKLMENRLKSIIYVYQTDCQYHNAIKDISQQSTIVISVESCKMGRHTNTDLLTIATTNNIYIFDIKFLSKIHKELRLILESNIPKKICHDVRNIGDNLKFQHNVQITSIFDTLVAHIAIGGEKNLTDLNDCVQKYLKVPNSFFYCDKKTNWHERPLDDNRKSLTAKKVLFIEKLYEVLLHEHLLRDFYKVCNTFANVYRENLDSAQVAADMTSKSQSSIDTISDFDLSESIEQLNLDNLL